jgi:ABC-type Zn2+ transport system substrate-binding protein/surface adhesin
VSEEITRCQEVEADQNRKLKEEDAAPFDSRWYKVMDSPFYDDDSDDPDSEIRNRLCMVRKKHPHLQNLSWHLVYETDEYKDTANDWEEEMQIRENELNQWITSNPLAYQRMLDNDDENNKHWRLLNAVKYCLRFS